MRANLITLSILVAAVFWMGLHAGAIPWTPLRLVGAAIAGVSVVLLALARLQLGASFSIQARAKALVTTGIYARIRNPIYVFGLTLVVGLAIALANRWLFLVALVTAPMQMVRVRREERVLEAAFGEEHVRYKAGTWF